MRELHQIFRIDRPLFMFDLETTGVDVKNDRIVEFGFQEFGSTGLVREWRTLVNPEMPIPPEVTKVHGISDETLTKCQRCLQTKEEHPHAECEEFKVIPTFKQLAPSLAKGFSGCDFAGKNIRRYDLPLLSAEFARAGVSWSYYGAKIIDIDRIEQLAKPRRLANLYENYTGEKLENAHQAMADIRASTVVLCHQMELHPSLPRSLDQLHELQWPGWIDTEGKFYYRDGVPTCAFGKWKDKPMKDIDKGYWQWILGPKCDMSAEIKAIAREALDGKFPTRG